MPDDDAALSAETMNSSRKWEFTTSSIRSSPPTPTPNVTGAAAWTACDQPLRLPVVQRLLATGQNQAPSSKELLFARWKAKRDMGAWARMVSSGAIFRAELPWNNVSKYHPQRAQDVGCTANTEDSRDR
jgi:hypothetical protein